jgi:hypothetical protein
MKTSVIIAGSGRSGTTWVLDSLADVNRMRTVFEPLNPAGAPAAAPMAYQYIEAAADAPELMAFMERVFSGNMRCLYELIGDRFGFDLARPMSAAAAFASVWCVENVLPLEWAQQEKYGVVAYEDLLVHPATEWRKVVSYLGLTGIPGTELLGTPSQQSSMDMREKTFTPAHIERWKSQLGREVIDDVASVLEQFDVMLYSVDNAMPVHGVEEKKA